MQNFTDAEYDFFVTDAARKMTNLMPPFHSIVANRYLRGEKSIHDCLITSNLKDVDHIFYDFLADVPVPQEDGSEKMTSGIDVLLNLRLKNSVSKEDFLADHFITPGEHDAHKLTAAWVRYFSKLLDNVRNDRAKAPDNIEETFVARIIEGKNEGRKFDPIRFMGYLMKNDPKVFFAVHTILHADPQDLDFIHEAFCTVAGAAATDEDIDLLYFSQEVENEYFAPIEDVDYSRKALQMRRLLSNLMSGRGSE